MSNNKQQPQKPPTTQPDEKQAELPALTLFGMHKRAGRWVAVVARTQGLQVTKSRVLEADTDKAHVTFCMERARHEFYSYGWDPFEEEAA